MEDSTYASPHKRKKRPVKKLPGALFQEVVDAGSRKTFFVNCGIIDLK
jgi:hypothetical protein